MIETYSFGAKKRIPPAFRLMNCPDCHRPIAQHNLKAHRGSKPCLAKQSGALSNKW